MTLQKEFEGIEGKIVRMIELYETSKEEKEKNLLKKEIKNNHDYLTMIKDGFPQIILVQYDQINTYIEMKGWNEKTK